MLSNNLFKMSEKQNSEPKERGERPTNENSHFWIENGDLMYDEEAHTKKIVKGLSRQNDIRDQMSQELFNVYIKLPRHIHYNIRGIEKAELAILISAYEEGETQLYIAGTKYVMEGLEQIKIFTSERPHEYDDFVNVLIQKGELNWYADQSFLYPDQLVHLGTDVTREYIKTGYGAKKTTSSENIINSSSADFKIEVFISHSSKDKVIAAKIAELIKSAFNLQATKIRCTSVPGYKLPGGKRTLETLREEVEKSKVLLAIVTENSIASSYVLFELGARWVLKKPTIPLLASSTGASLLPTPLSDINALSLLDADDLFQLIDDLADELKLTPERPPVYSHLVKAITQFFINT